ncbi:MAG: YcbK family protein [Pseudomonadota bacterium]
MVVGNTDPSRRRVLAGALATIAASVVPGAGWARSGNRRLKFRHLHTDERLDVVYFADGRYQPRALLKIDHLLRDWRVDQRIRIDHGVLDILHDVQVYCRTFCEVEVLSGYRTAATNAQLRRRSRGVAKRSLHMVGKAVDMRLDQVPLSTTRRSAIDLGRGGVGYYPRSNFVHVDTGQVRTWGG